MRLRGRGCAGRADPFLFAEEVTINFTNLLRFVGRLRSLLGEAAQKASLNRPFVLKKWVQKMGMVMVTVSDKITVKSLGEST